MNRLPWLVAALLLGASGAVNAAHVPEAIHHYPHLELRAVAAGAGTYTVIWATHAWGDNISASLRVDGTLLGQGSGASYGGNILVDASTCRSIALQSGNGTAWIRQTIRIGNACDGRLAGTSGPASVASRGPAANANEDMESLLGFSAAGLLSSPSVQLLPSADDSVIEQGSADLSVRIIHDGPWCGRAVLEAVDQNPLTGAETAIGAEVLHEASFCPANFPPVVDLGPNQTKKMRGAFVLTGSIADPDTDRHLVVIQWGDGDSSLVHADGGVLSASHVYDGKGTWEVRACANDGTTTACDSMWITQGGGSKDGGGKGDKGAGKGGGKGRGPNK